MLAPQHPLELTRYVHSYDTELYSLWHGDDGDEYCPVSLANRPLNCNVHMDVSPLQQGPTAGCLSMLRPVCRFGHLEGRSLRVIWLGRVCSYSFAIDSFIHYKLADGSPAFAFTDFLEAVAGLLFRGRPLPTLPVVKLVGRVEAQSLGILSKCAPLAAGVRSTCEPPTITRSRRLRSHSCAVGISPPALARSTSACPPSAR